MNRIDKKFKTLRREKKKAFIPFVTAGDPDLRTTEELVLNFERAGADIVELGVPFSDPLADGPTIQASSQRALKNGTNIERILKTVVRIRRKSQVPIALMTYYNPVFKFGEERFIRSAEKCGVDGVIIPDLPPEEAGRLVKYARKHGLATVFFLSPTTTKERMKRVIKASTGFIYYVSITGVTGAKQGFSKRNAKMIRQAKQMTDKPICIGFGVATAAQARAVSRMADGVIVGSAIVRQIERNKGKKDLVKNVTRFVQALCCGL